MKRFLVILSGIILLVTSNFTPVLAAQALKKIDTPHDLFPRVDEPFLSLRTRMLKQGWMPVRMHETDGYNYDGAERRLAERRILEVDSCSIDTGVNCIFYYRKRGICMRIDTIGEQVKDMKVTRWNGECPMKE